MRRLSIGWVLLIAACVAGGLVALSAIGRLYLNRPPFLIILQPDGKSTVVQFIQPAGLDETMVVSPRFLVNVSTRAPFQAALASRSITIPGAVIEHGDTTLLPGAFHIRFGDSLFQVMSHRIVVNDRDYEWLEQPVETGTTIDVSRQ